MMGLILFAKNVILNVFSVKLIKINARYVEEIEKIPLFVYALKDSMTMESLKNVNVFY